MSSIVNINVPSNVTILAGYEYGRDLWQTYRPIDFEMHDDYYIRFPEQIEGIATSWIDGFFKDLIETIGAEKAAEQLHISNKRLEAQVKADLWLYRANNVKAQDVYKLYASLADKVSRRAKKVASLDLDAESQSVVSEAEGNFYIALIDFLREIAYTYEANPSWKSYFGHFNRELILQNLKKLF